MLLLPVHTLKVGHAMGADFRGGECTSERGKRVILGCLASLSCLTLSAPLQMASRPPPSRTIEPSDFAP